jgi:hypothetical protein
MRMFTDIPGFCPWFAECVTLKEVCRRLHSGFHTTLALLNAERITVYRIPFGTRHRYFIDPEQARGFIERHGSRTARYFRAERSAVKPKGAPLSGACPHCQMEGRQWRSGLNTAGNREVKCGHCQHYYTVGKGKRGPVVSTCPHCAESTRQWRKNVTSAGNLTLLCGHCRKHYTVKGIPDAAVVKQTVKRVVESSESKKSYGSGRGWY